MRAAGAWDESRQTTTDTICPYCGVGCTLTLHVQDGEIVKATSPLDNPITRAICASRAGSAGASCRRLGDQERCIANERRTQMSHANGVAAGAAASESRRVGESEGRSPSDKKTPCR